MQEVFGGEYRDIRAKKLEKALAGAERQASDIGVYTVGADHEIEVACWAALECDRNIVCALFSRYDRIIKDVIYVRFGRLIEKSR